MKTLSSLLLFAAALALTGAETLTVSRSGDSLSVKSPFPGGWTLTRTAGVGGPSRLFNFRSATLGKEGTKEFVVKGSSDDICPWNFNGTYIGANHGDFLASAVICSAPHDLSTRDCGSEWRDSKGKKFYVVRIESPSILWVLSENLSKEKDIWVFSRPAAGETLTHADGRVLKDFKVQFRQLRPQVRVVSRKYLADGKELADKTTVECGVFTVEEEYDIIATDAVLKHVTANPGKAVSFNVPGLDPVLTQKIVYTYYPDGSCLVEHRTKFHRDVRPNYMGFIQAGQMAKGRYAKHLYYIPKTKPFTCENEEWDFANMVDFTRPIKGSIYFSAKMFDDPKNLPDRFVQYLKDAPGQPDAGFVCGYSRLTGCTVPEQRAKNSRIALFLYKTHKSYPHALDNGKMRLIKAGQTFHCLAYRQYFDPAQGYYLNRQGDAYVMYVDFHAPVKGKIVPLPEKLRALRTTLLEKSPGVEYRRNEGSLLFDSTGKNGYCVLKFQ